MQDPQYTPSPCVCRYPSCEKPPRYTCRGYCGAHYKQLHRAGELVPLRAKHGERTEKQCKAPGCDIVTWQIVKGYCPKHYRRMHLKGDINERGKAERPKGELKAEIIAAYVSGDTLQTLGSIYGYRKGTIRFWLSVWGIARRPAGFQVGQNGKLPADKKSDGIGYIMIRKPEHPNAVKGYVREHRYVMEQVLGRYLEAHEVVHHINNDPADNRIENLELMTRQEHARMHRNRLGTSPTAGKTRAVRMDCVGCGKSFNHRVLCFCKTCRGPAAGRITLESAS